DGARAQGKGMAMKSMEDRVALVTGSSRGIGAAIAQAFAAHGASVVVHGRDATALNAVRDSIKGAGGDVFSVLADVTSFEQIELMRHQIEENVGPVDILVANAGGSFTPPAPLEQIPED